MKINKLTAAIEAILFSSGEPVETEKIAQALEIESDTVHKLIDNLSVQYDDRQSGLQIIKLGDKYQMITRSDFSEYVRRVLEVKKNAPLSQAAFEVLAVVAYNQPVTKAFVEQVRGVDCSGVVNTLCQKGLLEEKGRLDLPGRPLLYGTTDEFLRCFSVSSLDELPSLPHDDNENANEDESADRDDTDIESDNINAEEK